MGRSVDLGVFVIEEREPSESRGLDDVSGIWMFRNAFRIGRELHEDEVKL